MKISLTHVPHISTKISIDLSRSGYVTMTEGLERVAQEAEKVLEESVKQERALDERVEEILEEHMDDIDDNMADERQLFYMIKRKIAADYGVMMSYEDRFSDISHKILDAIYEEDLIAYDVPENKLKNIINDSLTGYIADNDEIQDAVMTKIRSYKRKIIPGTDDFEILYEKLYSEELTKRGMA